MLPFRYLFRAKFTQPSLSAQLRKLSTSHYCSSENKVPTEDEKVIEEKTKEAKKSDVTDRLNMLLKSMDVSTPTSVDNTDIARPKRRGLKKDLTETDGPKHTEAITHAAKEVAESLGGDVKQTEAQLLSKVSSQSTNVKADGTSSISSSSSSSGSSSSSDSSDDETHKPNKEGASSKMPGIESVTPANAQPKKTSLDLSELLVGMKIDRNPKLKDESRAHQVRKILGSQRTEESQPWRERSQRERAPFNRERSTDKWNNRGNERRKDAAGYKGNDRWDGRKMDMAKHNMAPVQVKLFADEALGIFDPARPPVKRKDACATWTALKDREARLAATRPPANHFEEMILWTEQGKLWRFPIDNEQGLEEERAVSFAEHVFLESHLEPWCPRKGPVRHFMELVCVGLSKNPYLTAGEKRDHIDWFREYFEKKHDILLESGALAGEEGGQQRAITSA